MWLLRGVRPYKRIRRSRRAKRLKRRWTMQAHNLSSRVMSPEFQERFVRTARINPMGFLIPASETFIDLVILKWKSWSRQYLRQSGVQHSHLSSTPWSNSCPSTSTVCSWNPSWIIIITEHSSRLSWTTIGTMGRPFFNLKDGTTICTYQTSWQQTPSMQPIMRTSSARRSKVSELGFLIARWLERYLSAWRPSLWGLTVYKDVMSMVKIILFSPGITEYFKRVVAVFDIWR